MAYKVKICGLTSVEDARLVVEAGADYLGVVVNVGYSPRSLSAEQAEPIFRVKDLRKVVLLLEPSEEEFLGVVRQLRPDAVQLVGEEDPELVRRLAASAETAIWKSVHLTPAGASQLVSVEDLLQRIHAYRNAGAVMVVLDTVIRQGDQTAFGGTGVSSDWNLAREIVEKSPLPIMLAGGLGPENVAEALREVHPFGVDMASGVESAIRRKNGAKVKAVVEAAKRMS